MIGAVMMAVVLGLTGFVAALGAGYSFPAALAVYSVLGTVTLVVRLLSGYNA